MRRIRNLVFAWTSAVLVIAAAPAQAMASAAALGSISFPDVEDFSGRMSSVAIGVDGLPIISYRQGGHGGQLDNLRVAHCNDVACTSATTTTDLDLVGDVGLFTSLKIGTDGLPLISYIAYRNEFNQFTEDLRVAHCHDIACTSATITTLDSASWVRNATSLTIGADGLGLIAYTDYTTSGRARIKVAHCRDIACTSATTTTTIDTVNIHTDRYLSFTTGTNGLGLLSYHDDFKLKVAACTNSDCTTKTISIVDQSTSQVNGGFSSVALGLDGLPLISYRGANDLMIAHCSNPLCTASTTVNADPGPDAVGRDTAMAIGADGRGVVSYLDGTNNDLKVAHCDNVACSTVTKLTVDAFGDVGQHNAITIGTDGLPLISSFGDGPNGSNLRVLHCGTPACTGPITKPF